VLVDVVARAYIGVGSGQVAVDEGGRKLGRAVVNVDVGPRAVSRDRELDGWSFSL
jgi:hypothetical protein